MHRGVDSVEGSAEPSPPLSQATLVALPGYPRLSRVFDLRFRFINPRCAQPPSIRLEGTAEPARPLSQGTLAPRATQRRGDGRSLSAPLASTLAARISHQPRRPFRLINLAARVSLRC
ncbi:hypothetical protein FCM35_KLT00655 [Carex littledalei]|uniref:Uncharacterized protein n=1 Tax=Carex littledalei TaxID=544730 RepID=A0A833RK22_9POAL|nr:hypothetical protein FCM35_KLT00655 [Carex littledalei]